MIRGTGIDLIEIERIERIITRRGEKFLARVFTPGEVEYSYRSGRPARHLAARFAAKEAVLKALGMGLRQVNWTDIEIRRDELGKPLVCLHGQAGVIAREKGIGEILITLSHSREYAIAQAIAL